MNMTSREQFEQAIKARFGDSIDYRVCKNSDGEYMAWDMQVALWAWQAASKASELQLAAVVVENAGLKTVLEEIINADEPDYHDQGMGCGVEDRGYQRDGYSACYYGWESAMERVYSEVIPNSLPETPETDAYLAEVRAQARDEGINYAASRLAAAYNHGFIGKSMSEVADVVHMILDAKTDLANDPMPAADGLSGEYAEKSLVEFAAQLRQGAGQ